MTSIKKLLSTLFIILCCQFIHAQNLTSIDLPLDSNTKIISFSEVVEVPTNSQNTLFHSIRTWATSTPDILEKKIVLSDSNTYEITLDCKDELKKVVTGEMASWCFVKYVVTVYVKDNKYKAIVRNFVHEGCNRGARLGIMKSGGALEQYLDMPSSLDRRFYDRVLELTKEKALNTLASLKSSIVNNKNERNF